MTTIKKILLGTSTAIILLCILSFFVSKSYEVHTQMEINVPGNFIYNLLNNLNHQTDWNSKATKDTSFTVACAGSPQGAGVSCDYSSRLYGNGVFRILHNHINDSITITDEQKSGNEKTFTYKLLAKDSVTTLVKVTGSGTAGFITNLWKFIHKWKLKKQIHQNLDNIKVLVINRYKNKIYNEYPIKNILMDQKYYIAYRSEVDFENVQQYYSKNISGLYQKALENNLSITGNPSGLFYKWDDINKKTDMAAALPTGVYINVMDTETITISSNQALIIEYKGDNNKSAGAHQAMDEYMLDHYLENLPPVTEEYLTDPAKESDPSKWSTNIIYYVQAKK